MAEWSGAIFSSRIEASDEPDPLPEETAGSQGTVLWDVPRTWRMRVLAGPSSDDHLMLRGREDGSAYVEISRPDEDQESIELPTWELNWSDSPQGTAGVLYRFGGDGQDAEYYVFQRTSEGWTYVHQGVFPGPVIAMDVSDRGDVAAAALKHGLTLRMADGTQRQWPLDDYELPTMGWLHNGTVTFTRHTASSDGNRTLVWRYDEAGDLAWREHLEGHWTISFNPVTGAVLASREGESITFGPDHQRVAESATGVLRVFGQDGSLVTVQPDGTVHRRPAT